MGRERAAGHAGGAGAGSTRQRILDCARDLFARYGFDATSVRMIARSAGVTDPAVYYHFPGKYDLLRALMVEPAYGPRPPARTREDVAARLEALFAWWAQNIALVRVLLRQQLLGDPEALAYFRDGEASYREEVRALVAGAGLAVDAEAAADLLFHTLSGILWDAILSYGEKAEEVLQQPLYRERVRVAIERALQERACG
ncbi:helix-turn-helix domain-containing protein [Tepidiforma sp.]|uniref:TetR/AcrR family transcriptional regulator n=1 Tax=Tepidiforma sp. TaxID=2682230 RepID=UPI002ADD36C8|nr:helix-turn-helix domain-containing protein [Tepidiforma sp.]